MKAGDESVDTTERASSRLGDMMLRSVNQQLEQCRTYADYLDEITESDLLYGLLGCGMFSDKLPPIFTSEGLYKYAHTNKTAIKPKPHRHIAFSIPKNKPGNRLMGIPHPLSYSRLCLTLEEHWPKIKAVLADNCKKQKYKVSRIHLRKQNAAGKLFKMNYHPWQLDGDPLPLIQIDASYQIEADISLCFPSVYSHAISWALVGKTQAKANRSSNHWFNKIDRDLRNCTDSETHGILIGPDASNLIAEILLTRIDKELVSAKYRYVRNIDDYTCFVNSQDTAERFLIDLDEQLLTYGLQRNQKKTSIYKLPISSEVNWVSEMRAMSSELPCALDRGDLRRAFDRAVTLMDKNDNNVSIIVYLLKLLGCRKLTTPAAELLSSRMLQLVRLYPYLVTTFEELVIAKYDVDTDDIRNLSNDLFKAGINSHNWFPAYYAFYYAMKYGFALSSVKVDDIIDSDDCLLKTFEYLYSKKKNNRNAIQKLKNDARKIKASGDDDQNWLFVYEALTSAELKGSSLEPLKTFGTSFTVPIGNANP